MRPILFEIFGWEVPSWHFFFVLAAFIAFFVAWFCAKWALQKGHPVAPAFIDALPNVFVVCYVAGWFGARALSIVVEQFEVQSVSQFVVSLFQIGPMTFYGGALAAILCGLLFCRLCRISLPFALDCGVLGGVFALGVGRIGCHLNGDDFGLPVADQANPPWWAVKFSILQDGGLYRYPVQLEEALASFFIGCVGVWLFQRASCKPVSSTLALEHSSWGASGRTAAWVALLSSAHRFFNEIFRGDPRGFFPGTQISTSSGIALLIVIFCALCLARIRMQSSTQPHLGIRS